jgi:hypothetical protein
MAAEIKSPLGVLTTFTGSPYTSALNNWTSSINNYINPSGILTKNYTTSVDEYNKSAKVTTDPLTKKQTISYSGTAPEKYNWNYEKPEVQKLNDLFDSYNQALGKYNRKEATAPYELANNLVSAIRSAPIEDVLASYGPKQFGDPVINRINEFVLPENKLNELDYRKIGLSAAVSGEKSPQIVNNAIQQWNAWSKDPTKLTSLSQLPVDDDRLKGYEFIAGAKLPQSEQTLIKALSPGETLGGTRIVNTSPTATYFVDATQQGPKISAAPQSGLRSIETATNITPIVEYKTVPDQIPQYGQATGLQASLLKNAGGDPNNVVTGYVENPFADTLNALLENQAKNFQKSITSQLLSSIFDKTATQTEQPVYSFSEKGLTSTNPLAPPEYPKDGLKKQIEEGKEIFADKEVAAKQKADEEAKKYQAILDAQAKTNADLESKRLANAQAAEASRLRASQKFEYDSAIESALKAAEGNSSFARRQFAAQESRQKSMDAERLAQIREKRGNPAGYAGGFAQKAIQPTPATPAAIKAPAMKAPQPPAPIEPANKVASSFLPPKVDGLQFGGT